MNNSPATRRSTMLVTLLTGVAAAALALSGCQGEPPGSDREEAPAEERGSTDDHDTGSSDKSDSSSESPAPSATPEPKPAADGTDLDACRDVDCQVELGSGDVLHPKVDGLPLDTITVEKIEPDRVELSMAGRTGQGMTLEGTNIEISSECTNNDCHDSGALTVTTEVPGKINHVDVRLDEIRDDHAILTFQPGKASSHQP